MAPEEGRKEGRIRRWMHREGDKAEMQRRGKGKGQTEKEVRRKGGSWMRRWMHREGDKSET